MKKTLSLIALLLIMTMLVSCGTKSRMWEYAGKYICTEGVMEGEDISLLLGFLELADNYIYAEITMDGRFTIGLNSQVDGLEDVSNEGKFDESSMTVTMDNEDDPVPIRIEDGVLYLEIDEDNYLVFEKMEEKG